MLITNATRSEKHIQWNKKLEQCTKKPNWYDICRPKEEKGIEHVKGTDYADNAPADMWCTVQIEYLMQTLDMLLVSEFCEDQIEQAIQEYHDENERVPVVLRLVDRYNEAEPFHEQCKDQATGHYNR